MGVDLGAHSLVELVNIQLRFKKLLGFFFVNLHILLVLSLELDVHLVELLPHLIHRHCVSYFLVHLCNDDRVLLHNHLQLLDLRERRFKVLQFFHDVD